MRTHCVELQPPKMFYRFREVNVYATDVRIIH